jgi:hypothetical protein
MTRSLGRRLASHPSGFDAQSVMSGIDNRVDVLVGDFLG